MKILIVNAGSSSLKYQLIDKMTETCIAKGNCEKIGLAASFIGGSANGQKFADRATPMHDHTEAFNVVKEVLTTGETKVIDSIDEIAAIGHRIVQGGALFNKSMLVTEDVINGIESLVDLAPLHNPAHLQGIRACLSVFGDKVPQVVVFDNAFHSTMPPEAYMFPLPYESYEKYQIRRYGFHGTSHRFVSARCAELMGKPLEEIKMITCHIGNGASITAIKNGKVIDTSMGLTPLDGFAMGTRCGAVDPSAILYLEKKLGLDPDEMSELLNKKSGVLGISGVSSDDREVKAAATDPANPNSARAKLARAMQWYEIRKVIGGYIAALEGVDAIVFTGGLGENTEDMRMDICNHFAFLGVKTDSEVNAVLRKGKEGEISTADSAVRVFVIPTNEELLIARDTKTIAENLL